MATTPMVVLCPCDPSIGKQETWHDPDRDEDPEVVGYPRGPFVDEGPES